MDTQKELNENKELFVIPDLILSITSKKLKAPQWLRKWIGHVFQNESRKFFLINEKNAKLDCYQKRLPVSFVVFIEMVRDLREGRFISATFVMTAFLIPCPVAARD